MSQNSRIRYVSKDGKTQICGEYPPLLRGTVDMSKPHKGVIDNWRKLKVPLALHDPYTLNFCIFGKPKGHPEFSNWIRTSRVVKMEGNEIETLNSRYTLGEPMEL